MLIIYRPKEDKIIWYKSGPWLNQHDASFDDRGKILLFNNNNISVINQRTAENYFFENGKKNSIIKYDIKNNSISTPYSECTNSIQDKIFTITGGFVYEDKDKVLIEYTDKGITLVCSKSDNKVELFGRKINGGIARGGGMAYEWLQNFEK